MEPQSRYDSAFSLSMGRKPFDVTETCACDWQIRLLVNLPSHPKLGVTRFARETLPNSVLCMRGGSVNT